MKVFNALLTATVLTFLSASASAVIIDFAADANNNEKGHTTLIYPSANMSITGWHNPSTPTQAFAYMDHGNAGLGVCKKLLVAEGSQLADSSNKCDPGSDDNVTTNEWLEFVFSVDTWIQNIWVNNSHDGGFVGLQYVDVNGTPTAATTSSLISTPLYVAANTVFKMEYNDVTFYVNKIQTQAVPEAGSLMLMLLGLAGLAFSRRRIA